MKASEFKKIASAIGLFANVRETAKPPESLIGVQVHGGVAKLIAGRGLEKFGQGVIVTLDGEYTGKYSYTVQARPFLQAAKVITAKQEIEIDVAEKGVTISTSDGGKIFLKAEGELREAGFPKKPRLFVVRSQVTGAQFAQLAKVFDTVHGDFDIEAPSLEQVDGVTHLVAVQPSGRAMYAHLEVPGELLEPESNGYSAAAYAAFWQAMKPLEDDGVIEWGEDGLLAVSGRVELYSTPYKVAAYDAKTRSSEPPRNPDPWPIMSLKGEPSVGFTIDKKTLIEIVRGVMPFDEHGRVVLEVKKGELKATAFGAEGGMTVPVDTLNEGHRACNAEYLLKLLRAIEGKSVTIGWAQQPAMILGTPEMVGWTILLAPVALNA
jgi:hypothetical protein